MLKLFVIDHGKDVKNLVIQQDLEDIEDFLRRGGRLFNCQDLMGKPFEYGGRGPDAYDCYGLMIELNKRLDRQMPQDYISMEDCYGIQEQINDAKLSIFHELEEPKPFCLVTFFIIPRVTSHIGMVLPSLYQFIHIMRNTSVSIDRLDSIEWKNRITGYWEHVSWK